LLPIIEITFNNGNKVDTTAHSACYCKCGVEFWCYRHIKTHNCSVAFVMAVPLLPCGVIEFTISCKLNG